MIESKLCRATSHQFFRVKQLKADLILEEEILKQLEEAECKERIAEKRELGSDQERFPHLFVKKKSNRQRP